MNFKIKILLFLSVLIAIFSICDELNAEEDLKFTLDPKTGVITTSKSSATEQANGSDNTGSVGKDSKGNVISEIGVVKDVVGTSKGDTTFTLDAKTGLITTTSGNNQDNNKAAQQTAGAAEVKPVNETQSVGTSISTDADVTADDLQKIETAINKSFERLADIGGGVDFRGSDTYVGEIWEYESKSKTSNAGQWISAEENYRNTVDSGCVFRTRNINSRAASAALIKPLVIKARQDLQALYTEIAGLHQEEAKILYPGGQIVRTPTEINAALIEFRGRMLACVKAAYLRASVINSYYSSLAGLVKLADLPDLAVRIRTHFVTPGAPPVFRMDREVNWITFYLAQLVDRLIIINSKVPEVSEREYPRIQAYLRDEERDIIYKEIVRLAQTATLFNSKTGATFTVHQRTQVSVNILKNIADYIASKPLPIPLDGNRLNDLAARIRTHVATPGARIAEFIEGADDPTPREFFFAAKHALSESCGQAAHQFRQYLGTDHTRLDTGLGTLLRFYNVDLSLSGGEGLAVVNSRLTKFEAEADDLSNLFDIAARTDDPGELHPNVRDRLAKFGLVVAYKNPKTDKIDYAYNVINATASIGDFINREEVELKIPGDTLLDLINVKSVAITVASTYIPALGTRWLVSGLTAGSRLGHIIGKIAIEAVSELVSGVGMELAQNYAEGKGFTANYEKALIESLFGVPLQGMATETTSYILKSAVRRASMNAQSASVFHFFRKALLDKPSHAGELYKIINESTELLADTAMGFAVQPFIKDAPTDMAAFQAMLLQGAIAQSVMRGMGSLNNRLNVEVQLDSLDNPVLKKVLSVPGFRAEITAKIRERSLKVRKMTKAYQAAVSDVDFNAESHFHAMLTGETDFAATKQLLKDKQMPDGMIDEVGRLRLKKIEQDVHDARPIATQRIAEAKEHFIEFELRNNGGDRDAAEVAAQKRIKWERDLVNQDPEIPGAKTAISDIDRATRSTFMRRALVKVGEMNARLEAGDDVVTLGESIDTNEYYKSLPLLNDSIQYQERMRGRECTDTELGFGEWSHEEASHAIALSRPISQAEAGKLAIELEVDRENARKALELSNTPKDTIDFIMLMYDRSVVSELKAKTGELDNYFEVRKENYRKELKAKNVSMERIKAEMVQFDRKLAWARDNVKKTRGDLARRAREHMENADITISKETAMYKAKEDLYHERLKEISDEVWRLNQLNDEFGPASQQALTVRAKILRLLAIANRDGINTYSSAVTIDLIVGKTQIPVEVTAADGTVSKKKIGTLKRIADRNYTNKAGGKLAHYSDKDIQAAIRDQDADLIKHFNLYRMGKLGEVDLARAVAKYVQRIYYFKSILGTDIEAIEARPDTDPEKKLWDAAKKIVKNKGDMAKMSEIVIKLSRKALPSEVSGVVEFLYLVERSFPRFRGLTGVVPGLKVPTVAPSLHVKGGEDFAGVALSLLAEALAKDLFKIETTRKVAGEKAVVDFLTDALKGIDREEAHLLARQKELLALTRKHRMRDWDRISDFGREMDFWGGMHDTLIYWATVQQERRATFTATWVLDNHTTAKRMYDRLLATETPGDPDAILMADPKAGGYHRLKARLAALKERRTRLSKEREKARKAAEIQEKFRGLDMSGTWTCDDQTGNVRELDITHVASGTEQNFTAELYREVLSPGEDPWIRLKGTYSLGRLYGVWWSDTDLSEPPDPGMPALRAARHFDVFVNEANTELRFTEQALVHPDIAIDWPKMTCTRINLEPPSDLPPAIPTDLKATAISSTEIKLTWNASTDDIGVTAYRIYRDGTQIDTTSNTTYQDTGLSLSTKYTYTVSADDTAGNESGQSYATSATTFGAPARPSGLQATAISSSKIQLSWSEPTDNTGVTAYRIYRDGTQIDTTSNTTYQDTGLSLSTTYTYTISVEDIAGNESGQSSETSATTSFCSDNVDEFIYPDNVDEFDDLDELIGNPEKSYYFVYATGAIQGSFGTMQTCVYCHGNGGKGTPEGRKRGVPDFTDAGWQSSKSNDELIKFLESNNEACTKCSGRLSACVIQKLIIIVRGFVNSRAQDYYEQDKIICKKQIEYYIILKKNKDLLPDDEFNPYDFKCVAKSAQTMHYNQSKRIHGDKNHAAITKLVSHHLENIVKAAGGAGEEAAESIGFSIRFLQLSCKACHKVYQTEKRLRP